MYMRIPGHLDKFEMYTYTIKSNYISGAPDLGDRFLPSQKFTYIQITYIQIRL